jgi:propanediol dehydratase large subunit
MAQSRRFAVRAAREINKDTFIQEWPEAGLVLLGAPADPLPTLRIENGEIVEMDGKPREQFDMIDTFIARHSIALDVAEEAMATDSLQLARMLVDIHVPRADVIRLINGLTAAKLVEVVSHLNVVEMMMALQKVRVRRTPANQAHVTNRKDSPALLAADAAEAAFRGFAEIETTVGVARYAPWNALAVLVGAQTGRGGVLTQCAVEEAMSLTLAMKGLTTYAETLSVYGTDAAFTDGDDTPWSKGFLASAYASRGVKIRFTSGTGSEALMAHANGHSMLYLEALCLLMTKGAGSQGVQNGSISCIALPESLPGGVAGVAAENLLAAMLDLEVATGNDAMASHSDIRKSAKLMLQFLPGSDFIFSGYSSIPKQDNMFGGGNLDADDLDDYLVLQRDMKVDGGLRPVREQETLAVRQRAAHALAVVFEAFGFPPITQAEIDAAVTGYASPDMPDRNMAADLAAAERFLSGPETVLGAVRALAKNGFPDVARNIFEIERQRVIGDYLQPAAIFTSDFDVLSGVNDANDYQGPGTGYRLSGPRWSEICDIPQAYDPRQPRQAASGATLEFEESGEAQPGTGPEVVIAVGPAFGTRLHQTVNDLPLSEVLAQLLAGITEQGIAARLVKIYRTSDLGQMSFEGSRLSGSGIAIGIQSKGTTVIHRRGLLPLNNLELFSQASQLSLEHYHRIGQNAAGYALGRPVEPLLVPVDNMARLKFIVKTTILHRHETECVRASRPPELLTIKPRSGV